PWLVRAWGADIAPGKLRDQHRGTALGQKQERQAGGDRWPVVEALSLAAPRAVLLLDADQVFAADAIPVFLPEEPSPSQPAGSLDAVQAVERVNEGSSFLADVVGEDVADPDQSMADGRGVVVPPATRVDALVIQAAFLGDVLAGDEHVAQAGGGHGQRGR